MKLKLLATALVGTHSYDVGEVVEVTDEKRARVMIGRGTAEQAAESAKVTEPGEKKAPKKKAPKKPDPKEDDGESKDKPAK